MAYGCVANPNPNQVRAVRGVRVSRLREFVELRLDLLGGGARVELHGDEGVLQPEVAAAQRPPGRRERGAREATSHA